MRIYRKVLLIICVALFICSSAGCNKDIVETEQTEKTDNNDLCSYSSEYELRSAQIDRLADKMVDEGRISDPSELFLVNAYQRNIEYSYVHFHDYTYKVESEENVCYPYEIYSMSVSDDGEITYYYTVLDYYVKTVDGEKIIYAGKAKDEIIESVMDLETALKLDYPYSCSAWYTPYSKLFGTGMDWYGVFERVWTDDQLDKLRDPVTALETLYHLKGGNGTLIFLNEVEENKDLYNTALVKYCFADGDEISYLMIASVDNPYSDYNEFDYWRPVYCTEKDNLLYPELKGLTPYHDRCQKVYEIAYNTVTVDDLDKTSSCNLYDDYTRDAVGVFLEMKSFPEDNVSFYSLQKTEYLLVIKDDQIYRIDFDWNGLFGEGGFIGSYDFDGDGQNEYVYEKLKERGSGIHREELYLIDITERGVDIKQFNPDLYPQIEEALPEKSKFGTVIDYGYEDDKMLFQFDVFPITDDHWTDKIGYLVGEIDYNSEGEFEMINVEFSKEEIF
ncbi:MAG: hypothetical protein J6U54_14545 [Clostridiales bacterium]|nr:hypothetical protein [Clostridiales bacterium]